MKIYSGGKQETEIFTTQLNTETRKLELKVETFDNGTFKYLLYDVIYKRFGGMEYSCHAEPLDGFYALYSGDSKKPFGIAKDESEAMDRLMLKIQRRIKRMRANERKNI